MSDAKRNFDNYIMKNLKHSNKEFDKNNSLTVRGSQTKSLLDEKPIKMVNIQSFHTFLKFYHIKYQKK